MTSPIDPLAQAHFAKIQVEAAQRHAFLCVGPDCCTEQEGLDTWEELKSALKAQRAPVLRTKAACLRVCSGGPWMVVYPEGTWYGGVTKDRCARIVEEHLVKGSPILEWAAKVHPLPAPDASA